MIETVALGEEREQLRDRVRQHDDERVDALPLRVGQRGRRQHAQSRKVAHQRLVPRQGIEE